MTANPFETLGLPVRRDLDDEQVRAAWRAIAAATHPDRPDGGDLARYTAASAAFAKLRTGCGRSEAYADVLDKARLDGLDPEDPVTSPLPIVPAADVPADPPGTVLAHPLAAAWQLPSRIRRGRPRRLLLRAVIAAALSLLVLNLIPGQPAAPADVAGLALWFVLTGRKDLAPRPNDRAKTNASGGASGSGMAPDRAKARPPYPGWGK